MTAADAAAAFHRLKEDVQHSRPSYRGDINTLLMCVEQHLGAHPHAHEMHRSRWPTSDGRTHDEFPK